MMQIKINEQHYYHATVPHLRLFNFSALALWNKDQSGGNFCLILS